MQENDLRNSTFGSLASDRRLSPTMVTDPSHASSATDDPLRDVPRGQRPRHIAIIMDGNGRWAQCRNLPRIEGHRRGVASVRQTVEECARLGVEQLTLYCLSSENWKRPPEELDFLMHLLEQYMIEERSTIMEQNVVVEIIGRRTGIPDRVLSEMDRTIELSAANPGMRLCLAINYGGRAEMVDAVRAIAAQVQAGQLIAGGHQRRDDRRASVHGGPPRSRPVDPHRRRDARQQFPAVADQLCRTVGDFPVLA